MTPDRTDAPAQGSCVGYEIRSHLAFRTLRDGGGTPLHVGAREGPEPDGELVAAWHPRPGNPFHGRLLRDGDHYAFWASDAGWYVIDPAAATIHVSDGSDPLRRELRLFGVPTALCAFEGGDVSVHASAVEVAGHGVLVAGPSMYGKTTLAAALAQAGHRLLSEDTTRCGTRGGPHIYPGPAALRLRADVARSIELSGATALASDDGRVPLVFDAGRRGDGGPIPLSAIVILREAAEAPRLSSIRSEEAVRDVFALTFRPPTSEARRACFSRVVDLVSATDCFNLHRPKTIGSLVDVVGLIERHVAGS